MKATDHSSARRRFDAGDRRLPYEVSEERFAQLQARIGARLDALDTLNRRNDASAGARTPADTPTLTDTPTLADAQAPGQDRSLRHDRPTRRRLRQLTRRPSAGGIKSWGIAAAAAVVLAAGLVTTLRLTRRPAPEPPTLSELLSTASAETLRQAAAANYDDILYNPPF